jgi:SAM-dependent methyltransferase
MSDKTGKAAKAGRKAKAGAKVTAPETRVNSAGATRTVRNRSAIPFAATFGLSNVEACKIIGARTVLREQRTDLLGREDRETILGVARETVAKFRKADVLRDYFDFIDAYAATGQHPNAARYPDRIVSECKRALRIGSPAKIAQWSDDRGAPVALRDEDGNRVKVKAVLSVSEAKALPVAGEASPAGEVKGARRPGRRSVSAPVAQTPAETKADRKAAKRAAKAAKREAREQREQETAKAVLKADGRRVRRVRRPGKAA